MLSSMSASYRAWLLVLLVAAAVSVGLIIWNVIRLYKEPKKQPAEGPDYDELSERGVREELLRKQLSEAIAENTRLLEELLAIQTRQSIMANEGVTESEPEYPETETEGVKPKDFTRDVEQNFILDDDSDDEYTASFKSNVRKTFEEALSELDEVSRLYYETVKAHALEKADTKAVVSVRGEQIKYKSKHLVRFEIKRGILHTIYDFETDEARQLRLAQKGMVKPQLTIVKLTDEDAMNVALDVTDQVCMQIERAAEEYRAAKLALRRQRRRERLQESEQTSEDE